MSTAIRRSLPFALPAILAIGVLLIIARSCNAGPQFDYQGMWEGHVQLPPNRGDRYATYSAGRVTLSIKRGSFELSESGVPYDGEVEYDKDHAALRILGMFQKPLEDQGQHPDIILTPQPNGTILYKNPRGFGGEPVLLKRK